MNKEIKNYINDVLSERRAEFGGKAVCPFAAPELEADRLMIAKVGDKSLIDLIDEFTNSVYESALFIIEEDIPGRTNKKVPALRQQVIERQRSRELQEHLL